MLKARAGRSAAWIAPAVLLLMCCSAPALAQESLADYELNYSRGAVEFGRGRYEQAEAFFRAALKARPGDPDASAFLGQTLLRRKKYAQAEALFREMLAADPSFAPAHLGLGILLYTNKDYAGAKAQLLAAETTAPDDPLVHFYLGLVHHELGEFDESPARFQRAMALSPDLAPQAQYYTGVARLRRGAVDEARRELEAVVAAEPESEHGRSAKDLLARPPGEAAPEAPSRWKLGASAGIEYDTNVVLLPGGTSPPAGSTGISGQSDYRSVLTGSANFQALQIERLTAGMGYGIYQSFHSRLTGFDVEDHSPSAYARYDDGRLGVSLQYIYNYTLVGRSPYLNANTALAGITLVESANTFTQVQLRYMDKVFRDGRFLLNSSRNGKNWLAGVTQYLLFAGNEGRMWIGYIYDQDVTGGGSPTVAGPPNQLDNADWAYQGHHISTGIELPPMKTLEVSLAFDWIHQQYLNPNSYSVDGRTRRRDNVYSVTGAVSRDLSEQVSLVFQYTYNRDDTNVDVFTYTRNVFSLSLNASF